MDEAQRERWNEINAANDSVASHIELLKAFLRDFPDHGPAWWLFGRALARVSRFEEAEHALRKAMGLVKPPVPSSLYCDLGHLFREKGEYAAAEGWFLKAIDHSPDDAHGHIYRGAMLARLGRLDEAEQAHRRATSCKRGCVDEAYYNLGLVLRARERYAEALECFERAVQIDPQYKVAKLAARDVRRAMRLRSPAPAEGWPGPSGLTEPAEADKS